MDEQMKELVLRYQPHIYHDRKDPFPIRYLGCTIFTQRRQSSSFPRWVVDPQAEGAKMIIEYAVYYDYDIQHMYDLEHVWVGVDEQGGVKDCWGSFHGRRLRAAGLSCFRLEGTHPLMYSQPGKHAMLPDPELFELIPHFREACTSEAGGGLLVPGFLSGAVKTSEALDERITRCIRERFAFEPTMEYVHAPLTQEQVITWPQLLETIPRLIDEQIAALDV